MLTLSRNSRNYLKRHWKLLETWLAPTHMQLVNLKRHYTDRSLYDYKTDKWTTVASSGYFSPIQSVCIALNKHFILITGGQHSGGMSTETIMYNVPTKTKKMMSEMALGRHSHCMVHHEGIVYVMGGGDSEGITNHCEQFNLKANYWSSMPILKRPRAGATATILKDRIYVFGGNGLDTKTKAEETTI